MEKEIFYAKSKLSTGHQPVVKEHLIKVSELAARYGAEIDCAEEAKLAGMFHDFGKYSEAFQGVLKGICSHIDHAICGAAVLNDILWKYQRVLYGYIPVMEAINGHHDGILEYDLLKNKLRESVKAVEPVEGNQRKQAALAGGMQYKLALKQFKKDFPEFEFPVLDRFAKVGSSKIETMLFSRMLFSCLVDADYSVSASDEDPEYFNQTEKTDFDVQQVLNQLYAYRERVRQKSDADSSLNCLRDELFEQCGRMGEKTDSLFTLTAPTGTGKTLALFHFALRHCIATGKRRIIIVLPFLTLTEQNAGIYRSIFPEVLEDHSQSDLEDTAREFAARWSVPVIITTSVQFFESLFAYKPTDCRKLHNIANSVVIFDEAQTLPTEVTGATLRTVNELCRRYNCAMVFSTATQPDFDALETISWKPTEIMQDNARLYKALQRTNVEWNLDIALSFDEIAEQMSQFRSVCTIVNLRPHARKLYLALKEQCPDEETFFLTTDLCTAHRSAIVNRINQRLKNRLPCRVVATQCIEAGIDFDFDVLYRALAPLDSIIQAAGRCNRNGRLPEGGRVIVFLPDEKEPLYPSDWYEAAAQKVTFLDYKHPIDIHNPSHIEEYYQLLFRSQKDKKELTDAIDARSFEETEKAYQLIDNRGVRVIVPYAENLEEYWFIRDQALKSGITPGLMKKAAHITVAVHIGQKKKLEDIAEVLHYFERGCKSNKESEFYVLRPQNHHCYTDDMGLQLPEQVEFDLFC
ncbi:MAG: CRISPR-associated helicase Cas3' [Butyricicoccus sp.]